MSRTIIFQPAARTEFAQAISWYEHERPGLGRAFAQEVCQAIESGQDQPERFRLVRGGARIIRLRRFKAYAIYFATNGEVFSVLAVFHGARNPAELHPRLK